MAGRVFCPIVFWIVVLADSAPKSSVWPVYRSPVDSLTNTYTKYTAAFLRKRKARKHLLRASSPGRTRTYDPAVNSRLLYQLSYRGLLTLV